MSDIRCAICSEPWDQYGVTHGDMAPWEAKLFRQGAGCPSCEGQAPADVDADKALEGHLRSVVMESEDPDSFPRLHQPDEKPKWEKPADTVLAKCEGCDSELRSNVDFTPQKDHLDRYWHTPTVDRYYHHRPGGYDWDLSDDVWIVIDEKKYCPACATHCSSCSEPVFRSDTSCTGTQLYGDSYDTGASFPSERNYQTICVTCLEEEGSEDSEEEDSDEEDEEEDEDDAEETSQEEAVEDKPSE